MLLPTAKGSNFQGGTWSYECLPLGGVCRIDGQAISLGLRLEGWVESPPDVLEVERWFAALACKPTTVEDVARAAAARWGLTACASGHTVTHGKITFRVPH